MSVLLPLLLSGCFEGPVDISPEEGRESLRALTPSIVAGGYVPGECDVLIAQFLKENVLVGILTDALGEDVTQEQVACFDRDEKDGSSFIFLTQDGEKRQAWVCPASLFVCDAIEVPNHFGTKTEAVQKTTFFEERVKDAASKPDSAPSTKVGEALKDLKEKASRKFSGGATTSDR
jgi:hypothetical protein